MDMNTESENQNTPENEMVDATINLAAHDIDGEDETIDHLKTKLADAEKRVLMAHADMDNFRRRTKRDIQDQIRYATLDLISELLDSVDNLHRAIESYEAEPNGEGLVEGVKMVAQQISTVLESHGCKKIDAVGKPFDPTLHQAVQMQPSREFPANTVMADLRPGFRLHDRVIRPSQVFISTGPADSQSS